MRHGGRIDRRGQPRAFILLLLPLFILLLLPLLMRMQMRMRMLRRRRNSGRTYRCTVDRTSRILAGTSVRRRRNGWIADAMMDRLSLLLLVLTRLLLSML